MDPGLLDEEELIVNELTERDKRTVEKFNRQISNHSVLSIRSKDALDTEELQSCDDSEEITEEDALRLQRVIQAFQYYKMSKDLNHEDDIDGRKYKRLSSDQSYEFLFASTGSYSRYVSPGRFHVTLTEESKNIVKEVNNLIQRGVRRTQSTEFLVEKRESNQLRSSYANQGNHWSVHNGDIYNRTQLLRPESITLNLENKRQFNHDNHPNSNRGQEERTIKNVTANNHAIYNERISHANGHALWNDRFPSSLYPKERFRWAVKRIIRQERDRKIEEREKKRKDYSQKLWKRRGDVGWFGLFLTLVGPCAFLADSATDLKVASDHFSTGHPWWGTFTIMLVIFPALLMNIVSYFFYKDDELHAKRKPESGWRTVKITHCLQLGLLERYWHIFVKGYKIKFKKLQNVHQYQLYIAMNLDTAMLQMILAFTEDAPQLVLQLYVLIRRKLVEKLISTSLQDMWTMASICFSFISYSRALVNYISCLRDSKADKGQLRWYGYIAMWFWRAFMFTSRVLVLVFFATEFNLWFFLVLFLHFIIILAMTWRHKINFFSAQKGLQSLIRITIAYIHTFCYFILDARKTVRWAVKYYILIGLEAVVFSTLWFTNNTRYVSLKFELAGMSLIFLSFGLGLVMMVVYYKFLHPKFKRPQTKWYKKTIPKEELCENLENENEDDLEKNEGDVEHGIHLPVNRAASMMKQVAVWV